MSEILMIGPQFHGPPESGHGGYVSGLLAGLLRTPCAEITLFKPPPLGRPLKVTRDDGAVRLTDDDALIAEGRRADLDTGTPAPPSFAEAEAASDSYPGFETHVFPSCLACGPLRSLDDGLRLFPGRVAGRGVVASPWVPRRWTADAEGLVRPEFVWAALDCPGAWALIDHAPERVRLLGRMRARVDSPVLAGRRYVVSAWPIAVDGRKMYAGTAVFDEDGAACARSYTTWILIANA
jgi:hypothetical protein